MDIHLDHIKIGAKLTYRNGVVATVQKITDAVYTEVEGTSLSMARITAKREDGTGESYYSYRFDGVCHHHPDHDIVRIDSN